MESEVSGLEDKDVAVVIIVVIILWVGIIIAECDAVAYIFVAACRCNPLAEVLLQQGFAMRGFFVASR